MRGTLWVIVFLCFTSAVSCTEPQQYERTAECNYLARWPYKDFEVVICSNGNGLASGKPWQWSGDNIKIFKQKGKKKTLLRDFSKTAFGSIYGVDVEARDKGLAVTIDSDRFPGWDVVPLFTEEINLDTGVSTITPLIAVPPYDAQDVDRLWAAINKSEENMFPGESREDSHWKFFDLAYGNLFKLRDYAFRNPEEIEKRLKKLRKWDWNDGEVAEVYSQILSQVSYMKGKQVVLK